MTTSSSPEHGRALLLSTAATSLVLTAVLVANPAQAQNECGAASGASPQTVTCTATTGVGNPFAGGITYTTPAATDLTVVTDATVAATGPVSVTGTGADNVAINNAGSVIVPATTTTAPSGLFAATGTGTATITNTGTVSTAAAGMPGIAAISGSAATTTTAATAGDVVVDSTGSVTTSGAGAPGVFAKAYGTGSTTVTVADVSATGGTTGTTTASDGVDALAPSGGPVTVTVAKGGTITATGSGIYANSATSVKVTNYGTINGGTFAVETAAAYTGTTTSVPASAAITLNNMSGGIINGPVSFGGSNNVINNNGGTWNIFGTSSAGAGGTNVINNYNGGTVVVVSPPGATTPTTATITGLNTWNNAGGVIDISKGNSLDITSAQFNGGTNSTLRINANGPDGVLMLGSTGTGTTAVVPIDLVHGANPALDFTGIPIVTGASVNTFTLGGANDWHQGFVDYRLVFTPAVAATATTAGSPSVYTIFGLPGQEVFEALNIQYEFQNFWRRSTDSFDARAREIRDMEVQGGTPSRPEGWEVWVQPYGGHDKFDRLSLYRFPLTANTVPAPSASSPTFLFNSVGTHTYDIGLQVGADQLAKWGSGYGYWGFSGGLEQMQTFFIGDNQNDLYQLGGNIGVYGGANWRGFYFDGIGKGDFVNMSTNFNSAGFSPNTHEWVYGARGELGYRWPFMGFMVEPSARVSAIWNTTTNLHPAGALLHFTENNQPIVIGDLGGRIGATLGFWGWQFTGYAGAFWSSQWDGQNAMTFTTFGNGTVPQTSIFLKQPGMGSLIKVEYGLETGSWISGLKGFVEGANDVGGDGVGSWSARLGVRFSF